MYLFLLYYASIAHVFLDISILYVSNEYIDLQKDWITSGQEFEQIHSDV